MNVIFFFYSGQILCFSSVLLCFNPFLIQSFFKYDISFGFPHVKEIVPAVVIFTKWISGAIPNILQTSSYGNFFISPFSILILYIFILIPPSAYRFRAVFRNADHGSVVCGDSSSAFDHLCIFRTVNRGLVPSLPVIPIFHVFRCFPFGPDQCGRSTVAARFILTADHIVIVLFHF